MKRRFELSLSPDYVSSWGVQEAVRELLQNAFDNDADNKNNKSWDVQYDAETETLSIHSHGVKLSHKTLLMGGGTKAEDSSTVGEKGEGYKLALLVLCRLGHYVHIQNGKASEIWTPKLIDSKRYGSKILVIDTTSNFFKGKGADSLVYKIGGITESMWKEARDRALQLHHTDPTLFSTKYGSVLLASNGAEKGRIYVGGLYVTNNKNLKYGYNFPPEYLSLDRDRTAVGDFNLAWATSRIWETNTEDTVVGLPELLEQGAMDVQYITSMSSLNSSVSSVSSEVTSNFIAKYGTTAIPVATEQEAVEARKNYTNAKPVIVAENLKKVVTQSVDWKEHTEKNHTSRRKLTPYDYLVEFSEKHFDSMSDEMMEGMQVLLDLSTGWQECSAETTPTAVPADEAPSPSIDVDDNEDDIPF